MNLEETVRKLQKDISELTKLVMNARGGGGGAGEANTASNVGVGGVGLYNSKVGVDLQFKNINAGSTKISVTNDAPNKEVDIDVVQANIDHGSIGGLGHDDHSIYLLADGTRALSGAWDAGAAAGRTIQAGNLVAGGAVAANEYLQSEGRLSLKETTDPANVANYGKVWVRSSDSKLYFMDDSGNIYELTAAGTVTSSSFMKYPWIRHPGGMMVGNLAHNGIFGIDLSITAPGAGSWQWAADGRWYQKLSNAIAGNICSVRATNWTAFQARHNPHAWWLLKTYSDISHVRLHVGLANTVDVRNDTPNQDEIRFRFSTPAADANWQLQFRNAAGTTTIDTGVAVAVSTVYLFQLWTSDNGVTWYWDINGTSGNNAANVPLATQFISPQFTWIPESAAADAFLAGWMFWEYDTG